ncbi:MAG: SprT-like domain-containing protein [Chromatiales bacterium]|jgi:SprT protein
MSVKAVVSRTRQLLDFAGQHFRQKFHLSDIQFNQRGTAAGSMKIQSNGEAVIRYNRQLLLENPQQFLQTTVPHEVAHLVAYQKYGASIRPHGAQWRAIMQLFQADASRCHNYDTSGLALRRYTRFNYSCACRTHELTSIRHKRILRGQQYLCRQCGQALRPGTGPCS